MEQKLITTNEIQLGDEIIISSYSELKYLKVVGLPRKKDSIRFKCSVKKITTKSTFHTWSNYVFEQDVTEHNTLIYQILGGRDIFLVKREII